MRSFLLIFILSFSSIVLMTPGELWANFTQHVAENKTLDFNKAHFIFDPENYTALDINSERMKELYKLQDTINNAYKVKTYIFIVKYINISESTEKAREIRSEIRDLLYKNSYDVNNSIFTIASADSNYAIIYTGNKVNDVKITDSESTSMKNQLVEDLTYKDYYHAWDNFLTEVMVYCQLHYLLTPSTTNPNKTTPVFTLPPKKSKSIDATNIAVPIGGAVLGIGLIGGIVYFVKRKGLSSGNKSISPYSDYNRNTTSNSYYHNNYNNNYNDNNSYGGHSVGGYSGGGNSVGGNSGGAASVGGNSGGAVSVGGNSGGGNSVGGHSGGAL